jgi:hypothetical protein
MVPYVRGHSLLWWWWKPIDRLLYAYWAGYGGILLRSTRYAGAEAWVSRVVYRFGVWVAQP